jgi:hypothetical protein
VWIGLYLDVDDGEGKNCDKKNVHIVKGMGISFSEKKVKGRFLSCWLLESWNWKWDTGYSD